MNENKSTLDLTDSIPYCWNHWLFWRCDIRFCFCGGTDTLIHIPEIIIVVGTIFFDFMHPSEEIPFLPAQSTACPSGKALS